MIRYTGPLKASAVLRSFISWLTTHEIPLKHDIEVYVCGALQGMFAYPEMDVIEISVVMDGQELETAAHEFVHYEQYRDKRPITERGVEARAHSLVRKWRAWMEAQ